MSHKQTTVNRHKRGEFMGSASKTCWFLFASLEAEAINAPSLHDIGRRKETGLPARCFKHLLTDCAIRQTHLL